MTKEAVHITVLLHEAVDALAVKPDGVYVDGTFGRGGHSRLILSKLGEKGRLVVFDKDPQAVSVARELAAKDKRVSVVHDGFAAFQTALDGLGIGQIDGALFDLGVSSPQIDEAARGFSFRFDAPLDMRMDPTRGQSAAEWLASASEDEIHEVIKNYGEERFSRQIARAIVTQRAAAPIDTTAKLAAVAAQNVRTRERGQDPATRTFQAVRIFINRELEEIEAVLPQAVGRLNVGGRLAVIAFHSLEDRIVKQFMKRCAGREQLPKWVMVREADLPQPPLTLIGKAQKASAQEVAANPRARSAVLRVAERTAGGFAVHGLPDREQAV
ncbi:16S rRNA (cytosine(1402)-N(4))-methyltransferase RsmH [Neisseria leonii]|uniref:16S rRNA (cytosine(1402)-N(4))-methyltransferase RsmH n=1 Tax=Neisseria leonii TaxID=2995413 RepID=UPI00237B1130|nr:16S rRNA (cytosine(1402)-N(4))-methyltransferase RsmH [Neisseria sp. 3986]MDD9326565.1 16S rRNA (cytosine(1402)-N(4))-methyltransferase RsmH [Neisseria sp. 3986]